MAQAISEFSVTKYFQIATRVMAEPGKFFIELSKTVQVKTPLIFLVVSSLFLAFAACLVYQFPVPLVVTSILFTNALGMTIISAGLGYGLMVLVAGRRFSFIQVFSVYAYAAGTVFLAAWIPMALWLTEFWKWWLIGAGLSRTCGLSSKQAWSVVALSIGIMVLVFWAMLPVIT